MWCGGTVCCALQLGGHSRVWRANLSAPYSRRHSPGALSALAVLVRCSAHAPLVVHMAPSRRVRAFWVARKCGCRVHVPARGSRSVRLPPLGRASRRTPPAMTFSNWAAASKTLTWGPSSRLNPRAERWYSRGTWSGRDERRALLRRRPVRRALHAFRAGWRRERACGRGPRPRARPVRPRPTAGGACTERTRPCSPPHARARAGKASSTPSSVARRARA